MESEKVPTETEQHEMRQMALIRSAYHLAYLAAFRDFAFVCSLVLFCAVLMFLVLNV